MAALTDIGGLTEKAQGVLFFAQYYSSPKKPAPIQEEHILLALLLVDPELFRLLLTEEVDPIEAIKRGLKYCEPETTPSWFASDILPPSPSAVDAIAQAKAWSEKLGQSYVGTEHLLLGLLDSRSSESVAGVLSKRGLSSAVLAERLSEGSITPQTSASDQPRLMSARPASGKSND
jgi:ATP-dependent Clp protease ATP-binding subunit ClpA